MTQSLTTRSWLATLDRIIESTDDKSYRTLARMLFEIITISDDPRIGEMLDAHAARLLGEAA